MKGKMKLDRLAGFKNGPNDHFFEKLITMSATEFKVGVSFQTSKQI